MNNTSDHHSSEELFGFEPTFKYPVAACYILIAVTAAVGNFLVCYAILANRNLRNNPTNLFLFSLAVSDLLTATLAMPFDIESLLRPGAWRHGKIMCITFHTVYLITVPTSILILLAISIDRFKSLQDPLRRFRRAKFITKRRALIVISILWVYCIGWAILPITWGWPWLMRGREPIYKGLCMVPYSKLYTTISSILDFLVPLYITIAFYIMIYLIANKHHRSSHSVKRPPKQPSKEEAKVYVRNIKAAKTTALFVVAIFICWQPFTYFSISANLYGNDNWNPFPFKLYMVLLMFGYLNSALNPFLFAFRNKRFRATYVKLLSSIKRDDPSLSVRRRSTISQSTLSSEIPETETKQVRLQSVRRKRETPDVTRRNKIDSQ